MKKLGFKLWSSNYHLINKGKYLIDNGYFQYTELMVVPNTNVARYAELNCRVLHAPHERFGFNLCDRTKIGLNDELLEPTIEAADILDSEYIILHPGSGKIADGIMYLGKHLDDRIAIENMPIIAENGAQLTGHEPYQIEMLCKDKFNFCFDACHSVLVSRDKKESWELRYDEFLDLNPCIAHICDGGLSNISGGEHKNIGDGDFEIKKMYRKLKNKSSIRYITLETPSTQQESPEFDIRNVERLEGKYKFHKIKSK